VLEYPYYQQGSKKVPSSCLGQVDFPAGRVIFHAHLPDGQGPRHIIFELSHKLIQGCSSPGQATFGSFLGPKGKLESTFFSSPVPTIQTIFGVPFSPEKFHSIIIINLKQKLTNCSLCNELHLYNYILNHLHTTDGNLPEVLNFTTASISLSVIMAGTM